MGQRARQRRSASSLNLAENSASRFPLKHQPSSWLSGGSSAGKPQGLMHMNSIFVGAMEAAEKHQRIRRTSTQESNVTESSGGPVLGSLGRNMSQGVLPMPAALPGPSRTGSCSLADISEIFLDQDSMPVLKALATFCGDTEPPVEPEELEGRLSLLRRATEAYLDGRLGEGSMADLHGFNSMPAALVMAAKDCFNEIHGEQPVHEAEAMLVLHEALEARPLSREAGSPRTAGVDET